MTSLEMLLRPETYWHWDRPLGLLRHNARINKGFTASASFIAEQAGVEGMSSPYAIAHGDRAKEALWEDVRKRHHPGLPSRMKALFGFLSKEEAENSNWFDGEGRILVQVRPVVTASLHLADAAHLDTGPADWDKAANAYWSGEFTNSPRLEAVIHGQVYLPEWETFPPGFGI